MESVGAGSVGGQAVNISPHAKLNAEGGQAVKIGLLAAYEYFLSLLNNFIFELVIRRKCDFRLCLGIFLL